MVKEDLRDEKNGVMRGSVRITGYIGQFKASKTYVVKPSPWSYSADGWELIPAACFSTIVQNRGASALFDTSMEASKAVRKAAKSYHNKITVDESVKCVSRVTYEVSMKMEVR